jgi:hypothetical protein
LIYSYNNVHNLLHRLGDPRDIVRKICGEKIWSQCKPVWGMNEEKEFNSDFREIGVPNLWFFMGAVSWGLFKAASA